MKRGHSLLIIGAEMTVVRTGLACAALIAILLAPATAWAQEEEVVYFHTDAIGSVRMITSATGIVIGRYDFMPFGEVWPANPPAPTESRQFTGAERDADTKLDYFGARYYRPLSGRFTTVDPGHVAGSLYDPQSWNAYAYALNNPFRFVDPFGMAPCPTPTDTSTCVEGRKGSGEFAFDLTRWMFEAALWHYVDSLREPPANGVYGAMPGPPFGRVAALLERPIMGASRGGPNALVPYRPPNSGFLGPTSMHHLTPGTRIDRYGGSGLSEFFSPAGTPIVARSLPHSTSAQLRTFEVVRPFPVQAGTAAPWFGQIGGGTQYRSFLNLDELVARGYLREVVR